MTENIEVLTHSSIRITGKSVIYVDPYNVEGKPLDADLILITHDHYDHFSPEDIGKVMKSDTKLVVPEKMLKKALSLGISEERIITVSLGILKEIDSIMIETVAAYNKSKPFHPKSSRWVGYIISLDGIRIYVAGDTDITEENKKVSCDVALVPIGGTYTMDAKKAAELVNIIKPKVAIPTHYGSVAGTKEDEEVFRNIVDKSIQVEIKMQKY